jgi:hypothetical protein
LERTQLGIASLLSEVLVRHWIRLCYIWEIPYWHLTQLSRLAQVVMFPTYIQEVLSLNLGQDASYSDRFFIAFLSPYIQVPG